MPVKSHVHLSEVFKDIEQQAGFLFFYDKTLIENTNPIDISIKNATLGQALSACLQGQPTLTYAEANIELNQIDGSVYGGH